MRVLIAPVGEQPTPNLIPLFAEPPESRAECVQFMVSDRRKIRDVADHLRNAIERDPRLAGVKVADSLPMDAWALDRAREECLDAINRYARDSHTVTVNLTGGTKIMSLAAYQAACLAKAPMIYVNTEQRRIIDFDVFGKPLEQQRPLIASISIETQLRAAGREFKANKPPVQPADLRAEWATFAAFLVDRYVPAHVNLISKILKSSGGAGQRVSFAPTGQSVEAAQRTHDLGLWQWDKQAGAFTITTKEAFEFLKGGWVETFAIKTLADSKYFDEVLGNVKVEGFEGEMDVVVARNGRLGIIECKTTGDWREEGKTFAVAKIRQYELMFGGPYATAVFALPSNENIRQWQEICAQYALPEPIWGPALRGLATKLRDEMGL